MSYTTIMHGNERLPTKVYHWTDFSTSQTIQDWSDLLRKISFDVPFMVNIKERELTHEEWGEKVAIVAKKDKKGFLAASKKVPKNVSKQELCLKVMKNKGYVTISTVEKEKDVPFETIESVVFDGVLYSLTHKNELPKSN